MIDPKFKENVMDVVIDALKAEGYLVTGNDSRYTFTKGRARTNVYKYKENYGVGYYYTMGDNERKIKHSKTIIKNLKAELKEQIERYAKADFSDSKLSEAEKMFTALGYDIELIRISTSGNYVSAMLALGVFDGDDTKITWYAKEKVAFKLYFTGECSYEVSTAEINIPLLEKTKAAIDKIQSAWEISIL